ncbi:MULTISPECIES: hypothetical protein [unclassified Paenibacillus]|uniref:hypothetical protein n=1 Tax=unclassified Paenibacillus TaxID=185978 RepID=UPI00104356C9|nr:MULTISPECIES: hypothetical protein [unclassified Paenibacillus]NIK71775.1 FMN phosphatase YigB (HAD superfamily) [Paenibacillus sp. BK720]TCM96426.1 hypothetical protein EV294_105293 [Paenibacillus sp. BK033]
MSISAFILDPEDEFERAFMLPVATEAFYKQYWEPATEELGLQWTALFQGGTDVEHEDVPAILEELDKLKEWVIAKMDGEAREHMLRRLKLLETGLPSAFRRGDTVVHIG